MSYIILKILISIIAGVIGTATIIGLAIMLILLANIIYYSTEHVRYLFKGEFTSSNFYLAVLELLGIMSIVLITIYFYKWL